MLKFLVRNKQVAAMLGVLAAAAIIVIVIITKGASYNVVERYDDDIADISSDPNVFCSHSLPSDDRLMPSIGNGHIATNIFSDTVYMNGVYNGYKGKSRRARIPAYANIRLNSTLAHNHLYRPEYCLDTKDGVFKVTVHRDKSVVTQRIYAHRYYTRAIISQIHVVSKPEPNFVHHQIWIAITASPGPKSDDILFDDAIPEIIDGRTVWGACGKTLVSEDPEHQPLPTNVCVFWTSVPDHVVVPQHGSRVFTFAMTAHNDKNVARQELLNVLQEDGEELYRKHVAEWEQMHLQAGMDVKGDLKLEKIIKGIWYYYLSSLPADNSHQPLERFYGLGPTGLARGGSLDDYEGHNFWDTEIWMFPTILLLYPRHAHALLQYRLDNAFVASELARNTGHKGYRFPWESAYTGVEATQPCCPEVARFEQHVTADISFAARQYLATTRDEDWLKRGGCSLATHIADFWASRAIINYTTGLYDISNVMGPDEDHYNVTNSAMTNVVAGYSLYFAQYVACLCKSYYISNDSERYADIAWSLALPYDEDLDYHPQFQDYKRGDVIKQADVVLLGYPLQYPMNASTRANDLKYYESVTRSNGPAMTWSMHCIGQLQLNDTSAAADLFNKSYQSYVREPFKIWTENSKPEVGAVNFLTGMGGFLQTLAFGYAGISIRLDRMEINRPRLPPGVISFKIRGLQYLGANMTIDIQTNGTTLIVASVDNRWPLSMYDGTYNITLVPGLSVPLSGSGPFAIRSSQWKDCPIPVDIIGQNYLRPITAVPTV